MVRSLLMLDAVCSFAGAAQQLQVLGERDNTVEMRITDQESVP